MSLLSSGQHLARIHMAGMEILFSRYYDFFALALQKNGMPPPPETNQVIFLMSKIFLPITISCHSFPVSEGVAALLAVYSRKEIESTGQLLRQRVPMPEEMTSLGFIATLTVMVSTRSISQLTNSSFRNPLQPLCSPATTKSYLGSVAIFIVFFLFPLLLMASSFPVFSPLLLSRSMNFFEPFAFSLKFVQQFLCILLFHWPPMMGCVDLLAFCLWDLSCLLTLRSDLYSWV